MKFIACGFILLITACSTTSKNKVAESDNASAIRQPADCTGRGCGDDLGGNSPAKYLKIVNPESVQCSSTVDRKGESIFIVHVKNVTPADFSFPLEHHLDYVYFIQQCQYAVAQAVQDKSAVYINLNSGGISPEDGFFVRSKQAH